MRIRALRRPAFILAVATLAAVAGYSVFRRQLAERPSAAASPGVVREMEIDIAPELKGARVGAGGRGTTRPQR